MRLYDFQTHGVQFLRNVDHDPLRNRAAYLADQMGLGKTIQACVAARLEADVKTVRVVAKATAQENWRREWRDWGAPREASLEVVSWAKIHEPQHQTPVDLLIFDEAHMAKTPSARRSKSGFVPASRTARRVWCLSGTPMPNDPRELWVPIATLWPEILEELGIRSFWGWKKRFCVTVQTQWGEKVVAAKNLDQLRPYLKRIMLRRTVEQAGLDLPPIRIDTHYLPTADVNTMLLAQGVDPEALLNRMGKEELSDAGTSKLRRLLGQYKAPYIGKLISEELQDGQYEKIVVLAYHHTVLQAIHDYLTQYHVVGFTGDTPQGRRQEAIDAFQDGPAQVFLAQASAAGDSINLQAANEIVLAEPFWSPGDNAQAIKRVHRIGTDKPVRARLFAVTGTIDEAVIGSILRKLKMQKGIDL